ARGQAEIVAASVVEDELTNREELADVTERAAGQVRGRVIVVGPRGRLRADSAGEERLGIDYSTRPEIARALDGDTHQDERRSDTLNETILATAVPIRGTGTEVVGAVRVTQSVDAVNRATWRATVGLIAIGLLVLVLGLAAGALIAGQVAGPVRRLDHAARRVAEGDLTARAKVEGSAEQRRLARTFNDMTGRLERLLESHREFVADASHQLRTPLSGLRLRLEEARASTSDADAHEEIDAGLRELDRLSAMVSELLVLSQAGEVDAPAEQVDLEDAARRAEARWDGANGGRVISSGAPADGFVPRADLDRALDALIENALHYGNGEVEVRARPGAVDVLDRGPGLSDEDLDAVFERFHRGAAGRAGPNGTGLGLPIARELARRWGGDVVLVNRDGGGARATLDVPPFPGP
ncbi:MAG TPA: HAMP domain-containing sensor histidine kinase, partial [Solirubrobacteraceae bacterium]|nr:HAMP domain-containing sensor histidine kinase [Solirubrobacteraceae bacterium]